MTGSLLVTSITKRVQAILGKCKDTTVYGQYGYYISTSHY